MDKRTKSLTTAKLKYIAVISMLIDHFGAAFFIIYTSYYDGTQEFVGADWMYQIMRGIGRTAFPIYCFALVEGFFYTRSRLRYWLRLFLFSLLSEVPFDLALQGHVWKPGTQNVFFTLWIGFSALILIDRILNGAEDKVVKNRINAESVFQTTLCLAVGMSAMLLAYYLRTDYSAFGVLLILIFYAVHDNRRKACLYGYLSMIWEWLCFPAFVLIYFYNGQKGKGLKYFFYIFYPLHLLALYGLRLLVMRG